MTMRQKRLMGKRRFTLIEVMIVLIILASLAALVTPAFMGRLSEAKRRTARVQLKLLADATKDYYFDMNEYPTSLDDLIEDPGSDKWNGPYLDPPVIPMDPWNGEYQFTAPGQENRAFEIVCLGADGAPGGEKKNGDINHWDVN